MKVLLAPEISQKIDHTGLTVRYLGVSGSSFHTVE